MAYDVLVISVLGYIPFNDHTGVCTDGKIVINGG